MSIRCFIAIELDQSITKKLAQIQRRLKHHYHLHDASIKWVRPENIHLTLKFLGDVPDSQINDICHAVSQAAQPFEPFDFQIGSYGCFPPHAAARVLWVGLTNGAEKLHQLAQAVDNQLSTLGFNAERRPFHAHLTLARIKQNKTGRQVQQVCEHLEPLPPATQNASRLTVFQSVLNKAATQYIPLHRATLAKS